MTDTAKTALTAAEEAPLRVLVADDVGTNRQILQIFAQKLGYQVLLAEDGQQAVDKFAQEQPDLILLDVMMPVMDGYEAARRIKAMTGERWVPIVFLSALDKEENLVTGLDAGGDDYLPKPINFVVLQAKLRSLARAIRAQKQLEQANVELRDYRAAQEAENLLANDILSRQLTRQSLSDAAINFWVSPAAAVSGDVVAAARSPNGELFVMLADATGHGLAASISTMPLLTLFYEMVNWGMALSAIVARINDQLRSLLPSSRFVAATMLAIDPHKNSIEAWIGGLPPALVLHADGTVAKVMASSHLPLGIIDSDDDLSAVERFDLTPGSQIALFSDGLIESQNAAGDEFGLAGLQAALATTVAPADRLEAVKQAQRAHMGNLSPHDDVTLLLVNC